MSAEVALATVLAAAVVAYALRATLTVVVAGYGIPVWLERVLGYIGPAVLASMTVNFAFGGEGGPHIGLAEVLALSVSLGVTIWRQNLLLTLALAMPVLWLVSAAT